MHHSDALNTTLIHFLRPSQLSRGSSWYIISEVDKKLTLVVKTENKSSFLLLFFWRNKVGEAPLDFDLAVYLSEYCLVGRSCAGPNSRLGHNLGLAEPTRAIRWRWDEGSLLLFMAALLPCSLEGRMRLLVSLLAVGVVFDGGEKPEEMEWVAPGLGCFRSDFGGWE